MTGLPKVEADFIRSIMKGKHPFVGTRRIFTYPDYGTPDSHPDYTTHTGQPVTVLRQLTDDECDPECQPMLEVQADDGWRGHVHAAELDGTVRPLRRKDHKHAIPPGTADRYLTPAEINVVIADRYLPDPRLKNMVKIAETS
jgi:hypothetical protein